MAKFVICVEGEMARKEATMERINAKLEEGFDLVAGSPCITAIGQQPRIVAFLCREEDEVRAPGKPVAAPAPRAKAKAKESSPAPEAEVPTAPVMEAAPTEGSTTIVAG